MLTVMSSSLTHGALGSTQAKPYRQASSSPAPGEEGSHVQEQHFHATIEADKDARDEQCMGGVEMLGLVCFSIGNVPHDYFR